MLHLLAQADGGTVGSIVLAVLGLAAAVVQWFSASAARAERDTHAEAAIERHRRLEIANEVIEVLHDGLKEHELTGASPLDSAIVAAKSPAAKLLLDHVLEHGVSPAIPALPVRTREPLEPVAGGAALLAITFSLGAVGCTPDQVKTAEASLRTAATSAVGILTLAQEHPELVAEGAAALGKLAEKVDPEDAPKVRLALAHANAGNVTESLTIAKELAASLPSDGTISR